MVKSRREPRPRGGRLGVISSGVTVGCLALASVGVGMVVPVLEAGPAGAVASGCTIVADPTPSDFTSCPGADLSQDDLAGDDLAYADLAGAQFASCPGGQTAPCFGADLSGADLSDADLSHAVFEVTYFPGMAQVHGGYAVLTGADLAGANGTDATFDYLGLSGSGIDAMGADFSGASFIQASLVGLDLSDVNFSGAALEEVDLNGTTLSGAVFTGADISGSGFSGTSLVPADQSVASLNEAGAPVSWTTPDPLPGLTPGTCDPVPGAQFPVGTTQVICAVHDDGGHVGYGAFTVDVVGAPALTVTASTLATATIGVPYSEPIPVSGGYPPYSFKVITVSGKLPKGLHLDKATGVISGTPGARSTTSTFTVQVKDTKSPRSPGHPSLQDSTTASLTLPVAP